MYLDNFTGSHSGQLNDVGPHPGAYSIFICLRITFDDGYNIGGRFPNELAIQEDRPLGRRLSLMNIEAYIGKTLRIDRSDTLFRFYAEDIFIGLIGTTEEWTDEEDELAKSLLKDDQSNESFRKVALMFGRTDEDVKDRYISNLSRAIFENAGEQKLKETIERYQQLVKEQKDQAAIAKEKVKQEAIKSAIATIMSRNMSHNLGSHVLYYTKQDLIENASGYKNAAAHIENDIYMRSLKGSAAIIDFMKDRTNYIAALAEDSKYPSMPVAIWDLLSIFLSDMNGQSINYYLKNLVRSEGYSTDSRDREGKLVISLNKQSIQKEELANMFLSLPGGVLSKHGFYNLIENIIRNSAKYWIKDKTKDLEFEFKISKHKDKDWIGVSFYDKKGDALNNDTDGNSLIYRMNNKLKQIKFLERDTNAINKEDKGLKEMLLSYLWLTSNTDQESLSELIHKLDSGDQDTASMVENQFKFLAFNDNGVGGVNNGKNFGIYFLLPIHHSAISIEDSRETTFESADVRVAKTDELKWKNKYPRIAVCQTIPNENSEQMVDLFREAIKKRFKNIDDYKICFETKERSYEEAKCSDDKCIYFERHLNNSKIDQTIRNYYNNFPYVDSTSGANFTETLRLSFIESFKGDNYAPSIQKKIFALKIKEAALSKITIIDERLFQRITTWADINANGSEFKGSQIELSLKNIRVLNLRKEVRNHSQYQEVVNNMNIFVGNKFRSIVANPDNENKTHFLTIHLGLIEKIVKGGYGYNTATEFMEKLREVFSPDFICIHSGRGGLSKEMDELKEYPFIPFTTLDSLFTDSKFLLSQMFYSLKY